MSESHTTGTSHSEITTKGMIAPNAPTRIRRNRTGFVSLTGLSSSHLRKRVALKSSAVRKSAVTRAAVIVGPQPIEPFVDERRFTRAALRDRPFPRPWLGRPAARGRP